MRDRDRINKSYGFARLADARRFLHQSNCWCERPGSGARRQNSLCGKPCSPGAFRPRDCNLKAILTPQITRSVGGWRNSAPAGHLSEHPAWACVAASRGATVAAILQLPPTGSPAPEARLTRQSPPSPPVGAPVTDWWRGAVIYQVYPRSFADANGDGIGDLAGLTAHLDHIASLGVDAVWLSPFFTSPMRDFGYDGADYCAVDPIFGTLGDFDRLIEKAHALGLKIITDPFHDIKLYWKSPFYLMRGQLIDPMGYVAPAAPLPQGND